MDKGQWILTAYVVAADGTHKFDTVRSLSPQEARAARAAIRRTTEAYLRELFEIVLGNHSALSAFEGVLRSTIAERPQKEWPAREWMGREMTRHFFNWLLSVRVYLERTERRMERVYGADSGPYKVFRRACSSAYDAQFSYRFLYKLRNVAQHSGLPTIKGEANGYLDQAGHPVRVLDVFFERDALLTSRRWGRVGRELEAMEAKIPAFPHIECMMRCLEQIQAESFTAECDALDPELRLVAALFAEIPDDHDGFLLRPREDDQFDLLPIPAVRIGESQSPQA
jgi:hypothetical protein